MSTKKAVQYTEIPAKLLKEIAEFVAKQICLQFNEGIWFSQFPATFKFGNVTPAFKQGFGDLKDNNYRPVIILPIIFKIFEKLVNKQLISNDFNKIFSKF